ncbi:hypothetical protein Nepgr_003503 [Nepenthes gracilis]|uniref:Uncharacterized protein n=1 Tax=Nepenthes gracilis TaxID=150966 RepID=A0AAD3XDP2_NEPGR|nr:hypothetical protein Nepgr_003503 [Nepenthes gracilis]
MLEVHPRCSSSAARSSGGLQKIRRGESSGARGEEPGAMARGARRVHGRRLQAIWRQGSCRSSGWRRAPDILAKRSKIHKDIRRTATRGRGVAATEGLVELTLHGQHLMLTGPSVARLVLKLSSERSKGLGFITCAQTKAERFEAKR